MYWRDVIPSFGGLGRAIGSGADMLLYFWMNFEMNICFVVAFYGGLHQAYVGSRGSHGRKDFEFWKSEGRRAEEKEGREGRGL